MTITEWPRHETGSFVAGSMFEMRGRNLDLLPSDLVVMGSRDSLNESSPRYYWVLDSVSPDGSTAYFRVTIDIAYSTASTYKFLATPVNAPREWWTDYVDLSS